MKSSSLDFYLVQHGEALLEEEDPARPLSERGRSEVDRVARYAVGMGVQVLEILHSGKLRARQTAEILGQYLSPPRGLREIMGLAPMDDPVEAQRQILASEEPLMWVGDLPHLSRLVSLLLVRVPGTEILQVQRGAINCLSKVTA